MAKQAVKRDREGTAEMVVSADKAKHDEIPFWKDKRENPANP
ncbi:MAG: hypothetical protein ABF430_09475 [Acetobacter persici]